MTTLQVVRTRLFDEDFWALPAQAQDELWRILAGIRRHPFAPGSGYTVVSLRKVSRSGDRVAHFLDDDYRLLFEVDGPLLILIGVGPRPGFYRRLDRLRGRRASIHSGSSNGR